MSKSTCSLYINHIIQEIFFKVFLWHFLPKNGNKIDYSSLQGVVGYASILLYKLKPTDEVKIKEK